MNITTKIGRIIGLVSLSLSLVYCGQQQDGTGGGSFTVIHGNQDIRLYKPIVTPTIDADSVMMEISIEDETHLLHYDIERREDDTQAFAYIGQTTTEMYEDEGMSNGTYDYQITAVYKIDDIEYASESVIVEQVKVLVIAGPNCLVNGAAAPGC